MCTCLTAEHSRLLFFTTHSITVRNPFPFSEEEEESEEEGEDPALDSLSQAIAFQVRNHKQKTIISAVVLVAI